MESVMRKLKLILLGALILGQVGCATSDADLGYTPHAADNDISTNSSQSHGWGPQ